MLGILMESFNRYQVTLLRTKCCKNPKLVFNSHAFRVCIHGKGDFTQESLRKTAPVDPNNPRTSLKIPRCKSSMTASSSTNTTTTTTTTTMNENSPPALPRTAKTLIYDLPTKTLHLHPSVPIPTPNPTTHDHLVRVHATALCARELAWPFEYPDDLRREPRPPTDAGLRRYGDGCRRAAPRARPSAQATNLRPHAAVPAGQLP